MSQSGGRAVPTWSLVANRDRRPRAYILVVGPAGAHAVPLPRTGELTLGRDPEADVLLDDASVSRRHARLQVMADGLRVVDDDSRHGITVNGVAVDGAQRLRPGDEVGIGPFAIIAWRPGARVVEDVAPSSRVRLGDRDLVVADPAMRRIYELLARLGPTALPVLLIGETGVGKEHAAFAVHHYSARQAGPFVPINCAAIPEHLVESELFGHEKGAFSGATGSKVGLLEASSGGTVFFDEVGELPLPAQAKLLRALEVRRVLRVGAVTERPVDLRVVAATNRDLLEEVDAGRFRRDLLYRLNVSTVTLPPLRERPGEIAVLAQAFLDDAAARHGRGRQVLASATVTYLQTQSWPGNVRELRNTIELGSALALGTEVQVADLTIAGPRASVPTGTSPPGRPQDGRPLRDELVELEIQRMIDALAATGGVQTRAAALIGMPIRTFSYKLRQYCIDPRTGRRS